MNSFKILLKKDFLELHRSKKWLIYIICFTTLRISPKFFKIHIDSNLFGRKAGGEVLKSRMQNIYKKESFRQALLRRSYMGPKRQAGRRGGNYSAL